MKFDKCLFLGRDIIKKVSKGISGTVVLEYSKNVNRFLLMNNKLLLNSNSISNNTLANIESRDVALWIHSLSVNEDQVKTAAAFIGLPWKLVMLEGGSSSLIDELGEMSRVEDTLVLKRGLVQVIDSDPTRIELPPRCLPVYILDGKKGVSDFEKQLSRLTMLDYFRRSNVREVVVVSDNDPLIPDDFTKLWSAGFRSHFTFVSGASSAETELKQWLDTTKDLQVVNLIHLSSDNLIQEILSGYNKTYPTEKHIIRMRDSFGEFHKIDVTSADEPERPILDSFFLVEERNLMPLSPAELTKDEFIEFFKNPALSWRPYAANLPWMKNLDSLKLLREYLQKLESAGADENCIAFIASESGAGGTTLAYALAWSFAREGYPVLVAKPYPFVPDVLPVFNYLTHAHQLFKEQTSEKIDQHTIEDSSSVVDSTKDRLFSARGYETPWIIVFDTQHWQNREAELTQFRNMLAQYGRPVCILVVTGPILEMPFLVSPVYKKIAELNHVISLRAARDLGLHLNEFLRYYGLEKTETQWDQFYEEHTVKDASGIAAFWVTLSFWIQGQYDFSESIQQWIYKTFKEQADDRAVQEAVLQIAAMSSERLSLSQSLLPKTENRWPVWQLLEDKADKLSRLGLTKIVAQGEQYWALVHDILGRLLINALFYDFPERVALGFSNAQNLEHFRFLILQKISKNPLLGERKFRPIGETFATEIFKIDPDHGKSNFAPLWREVLEALDSMPQPLRDTSRVFRHHTAISRRRISKLESMAYYIEDSERVNLLEQAIKDINYALTEIRYTPDSELDLYLLNSLAHAYLDLASVKTRMGASEEQIAKLKTLANDTARRAYRESPNNSFVIETYIQNLLQVAKDTPAMAILHCMEALGVLYSVLTNENYRTSQLGRLANQALEILFQQAPQETLNRKPTNAIDVLVQVWLILAEDRNQKSDWILSDVPIQKQIKALEILENPVGHGNLQILQLKYDLLTNCRRFDFKNQIEILDSLIPSGTWTPPQKQLEYGILLFQVGRFDEGERVFRDLRRLWREGEQFVRVPERLRWLRSSDGKSLQIVHATIGSEQDTRPFARVKEFANTRVPFRPEEHGFASPRPGFSFSCRVSFTINGPFLRPLSAQSTSGE